MLSVFSKMLMLVLLPISVNVKVPQSARACGLNFYIHSYVDARAHYLSLLYKYNILSLPGIIATNGSTTAKVNNIY